MNCGDKIVAIPNNGESKRVLEPRLLKVAVKYRFSFAVQNASRDNVSFYSFLFEI